MPKLNELHATYEDQGLVLIGVHTTRGGEKMAAFVDKVGIKYPVAIDVGSKTVGAFGVNGYPDYYVIDRAGNMRVADLANGDVERTLKILLAEPPPVAPVLAEASAKAAIVETERDGAGWLTIPVCHSGAFAARLGHRSLDM